MHLLLVVFLLSAPPQPKFFESYSPVTHGFYGPIAPGEIPKLPFWYQVATKGDVAHIVILPEGRIRWVMKARDGRLASKDIFVRDRLYSQCSYEYDQEGRRVAKQVHFKKAGTKTVYRYEYDQAGKLQKIRPEKKGHTWKIAHWSHGQTWTLEDAQGRVLRRDQYDRGGRFSWSLFKARGGGDRFLMLRYWMDRRGRVKKVRRMDGQKALPALRADRPLAEKAAGVVDLLGLVNTSMTRREVHLAVGIPPRGRFQLEGGYEVVEEFYGCVLNMPTAVKYGPLDMVKSSHAECICGYCLGAETNVRLADGKEIAVRDAYPGRPIRVYDPEEKKWKQTEVYELYWHWVDEVYKINGTLRASAKHSILTPTYPIAADALKVGTVVLDADAKPVKIRSVKREKLTRPEKTYGLLPKGTVWWHPAGGFLVGRDEGR